jgi:hypothetical protein
MTSLLVALALTASTADAKPYMWGVGGSVNTMILPGGFPSTWSRAKKVDGEFPDAAAPYINDKGALSGPHFNDVRGDVGVGIRGLFYLNGQWRGRASGQFGFGEEYRSNTVSLGLDKILAGESGAFAFAGGELGLGNQKFTSAEDGAVMKASTFPLRANFGGYYKINKKNAIELSLFVAAPLPMLQLLNTDDGEEVEMGVGLNPLQYGNFGVEFSYYWGDFSKPRKKGKGRRR